MKKKFFFIFFIFFTSTAFSQDIFPVDLDDIQFINNEEKQLFNNYFLKNDTINLLPFFLSSNTFFSDSIALVKEQIDLAYSRISNIIKENKNPKSIKIIYDNIHKDFLKKYESEAFFNNIFLKGNYNCLTASALYGLMLEKFKIPFWIKEEPTHVYVIASYNTEKILLESTNPQNGYYNFSESFVKNYIENLYLSKLISKQDYQNKPLQVLFNENYFSKDNISLKQLVGLSFYNQGIFHINKEQYPQALNSLLKSYKFYPKKRNLLIIKDLLIILKSKSNISNMNDLRFLKLLFLMKEFDLQITNNDLSNEFRNVTQNILINENNEVLYKNTYQTLVKTIKDSSLLKEINYTYNYEFARVKLTKMQLSGIDTNLLVCYKTYPNNIDLQHLILSARFQELQENMAPDIIIKKIKNILKDYPNLSENAMLNSVFANTYLENAFQEINFNRILIANGMIESFDKIKAKHPSIKLDNYIVEKTYGAFATYYYKKGNKLQSKKYLSRGLELSPKNYGLSQKMRIIENQ